MSNDPLIDASEVATLLDVSRMRLEEITGSFPDFPSHVVAVAGHRLWPHAAVEDWAEKHPEQQGGYVRPDLLVEGDLIRVPREALDPWADRYPDRRPGTLEEVAPPWMRGAEEQRLGAAVARMTPDTHSILESACARAEELNHPTVFDPDHLLLAVLHPAAPGAGRTVLESLGITYEAAKRAVLEAQGDPFAPQSHLARPRGMPLLESANVEALGLRDEHVSSEHVLLAVASATGAANPHYPLRWLFGLDRSTVRHRVLAVTDGAIAPSALPRASVPRQPKHFLRPDFDLALSPLGHDPWRRRPWSSRVFLDEDGHTVRQGLAVRQYYVDRDGHTVLTTDGRPVHQALDDDGLCVIDNEGRYVLTPIERPVGTDSR